MSIDFKFNGMASIEHLNVRKEGGGRDIPAIDVKIKGEAPGKVMASLMGCRPLDAA